MTLAYTANPVTPLQLVDIQAIGAVTTTGTTLMLDLNRVNFSPETIQLTSSNPAVAPIPASLTIPAFTAPGDFRFAAVPVSFRPVGIDTPVTFTATLGGVTQVTTITIPKTIDKVQITRAELVVKNGSLRVDAASTQSTATLSLFNAAAGQFIGTMTNNGLSGGGAKYSFQGTVSPVTSLLLKSSLNGTATSAVTPK